MKFLRLLLIICLTYLIKGDSEIHCYSEYYYDKDYKKIELSHKSIDDCKDRLSQSEKDEGTKCCYQYGSKQKEKGYCVELDKYEYANIGKYIKRIELQTEIYKDAPKEKDDDDSGDYGDVHIDCYSQYTKITLIGFLLFLL